MNISQRIIQKRLEKLQEYGYKCVNKGSHYRCELPPHIQPSPIQRILWALRLGFSIRGTLTIWLPDVVGIANENLWRRYHPGDILDPFALKLLDKGS